MLQRLTHWLHALGVPLLCTALGLLLLVADPMPMRGLRNGLFDQYQRWQPRTYVDAPVRVVDIDDESLARLGQWPWPRTRVAQLVQSLRDAGVAVMGFDVIFAEPDRTSPVAMSSVWGLNGALAQSVARLPDHDAVFAATIRQGGVVLGSALHRNGESPAVTHPDTPQARELPYRFVSVGTLTPGWLHGFDAEVTSLPQLAQAAAGVGALTFTPDSDGVVRRVPLVLDLHGNQFPR